MVLNQLLKIIISCCSKYAQDTERKYDAYLVGYYGMQNSGDDALMLASVMGAKNELNAEKLIVSASNSSLFLGKNVSINLLRSKQKFYGQNRLSHYKAAYNSKCVIFGGGSVFHTAQDIEIKRHMMMLTGCYKNMAVGVSLGPFVDEAAKQQCKLFLDECWFVGVRDKESLDIARQLAPNANVRLTFDLAPIVTLSPSFQSSYSTEQGVLINVCPVPKTALGEVDESEQKALLSKMTEVIKRVWQHTKEPITLISLNGHPQLGDEALCRKLIAQCPDYIELNYLPYSSSPLKMIEQIMKFKVFLSMRLHGCVFGYLANTPVVALNYHNKCLQWCEQVGIAHNQRYDAASFNSNEVANTLIKGIQCGFSSPVLAVNDAVKLSLLNWRIQS